MDNKCMQMFWDCGIRATLRTYRLAARLGLIGSPISYSMKTVDSGGWVMKHGEVYEIMLVFNSGEMHTLTADGVDSISDWSQDIKVDDSLKKLLPDVPSSTWSRHRGEVDLLVGSNLTHLMPKDCYEVDNLRVRSSKFGSGFCIQGTSRAIKSVHHLSKRVETNPTQVEGAIYAHGVRGARIHTMKLQLKDDH